MGHQGGCSEHGSNRSREFVPFYIFKRFIARYYPDVGVDVATGAITKHGNRFITPHLFYQTCGDPRVIGGDEARCLTKHGYRVTGIVNYNGYGFALQVFYGDHPKISVNWARSNVRIKGVESDAPIRPLHPPVHG